MEGKQFTTKGMLFLFMLFVASRASASPILNKTLESKFEQNHKQGSRVSTEKRTHFVSMIIVKTPGTTGETAETDVSRLETWFRSNRRKMSPEMKRKTQ